MAAVRLPEMQPRTVARGRIRGPRGLGGLANGDGLRTSRRTVDSVQRRSGHHVEVRTGASTSLLFLFHCDSNRSDRRKPDLISLHFRDEAAIHEVMMTLVASLTTVLFSELDAVAFHLVDRTDVDAIRPDYFHVLFDVSHSEFLRVPIAPTVARRASGCCRLSCRLFSQQ